MRLYPSILVVSLALLESGSQASKVRGTAAFNLTTEAASVADNRHGLSLLPTTNGEDRMLNLPNVDKKTPDAIVKKHLEKLIPSLRESSSSTRPPTNFQRVFLTLWQRLKTLSDKQKIQLGVNFIHRNSLEDLITDVKPFMREEGGDAVDVIFSAMCKHLGDDVVTKVVMDVKKAGITSWDSIEKLAKAQFRYWQENGKSYADVSHSLRKLAKTDATDEEKIENFGLYAWMLDGFIKFRNNGVRDDKIFFAYLAHDGGIIKFADFISKGKQISHRLRTDAVELEKRYFIWLERHHVTLANLFASLKVKDDGIHMFSGPKFDFMIRFVSHGRSQKELQHLGENFIFAYKSILGEKNLLYWLARAAAVGDAELQNNAMYMANLLFKVTGSYKHFESMIRDIQGMEDGKDAAVLLTRLAYEQNFEKNLKDFKDPFGRE